LVYTSWQYWLADAVVFERQTKRLTNYYYEGGMALYDCEVLHCQGRSKENLYAFAWLSHESFHMPRSSCAT